jgi:hypothetical protein
MPEPFVVIATVQGRLAEEQLRSFLTAHGIPAETRGETLRTTHALSIDGIGAVDVLVPRDMAATARKLLAKAERGDFRINDEQGSK